METKIEHKSCVCPEIKVEQKDTNLYIEGYGAYFGNVDSYGDVIKAGAFAPFLASEDAQRVKLCWQHNFDDVIGVIEEMREDDRGLWFRAKISNTSLGKDAATLIEDGALNEFSIGYGTKAAEYPSEEETRTSGVQRILTDIYLYEISLVSRAANPKATLEGAERKQESINQNPDEEMEQELKNQLDALQAEIKGLRDDKAALEQSINEKTDKASIDEVKASIANLDESINKLYAQLNERKDAKESISEAICKTIESDEFKNAVADVVDGKRVSAKMEVKIATSDMTGSILRTMGDTEVNADAQGRLVFLGNIRRKDVPQDKSVILWLEGSFTDNTNYVGEGSAIGSADAASVAEHTRGLAKIAAKLPFTREVSTDLSYFLNWARAEAIKAIQNKVDTEILSGSGADTNSSTKKLIYGIIGQGSTAFSASTAGVANAITNANFWNLIDACDAQVSKSTNDAYFADTIYINPSDFAKYKNMVDANGRLLFEYTNGGIYTFLGKKVVRTNKMTAGTLLVADSTVFDLYEKLGFEIEIERVASTDSYVMYLRWRGQVVVPASKKKAVIYVSNIGTAIAAITAGSGSGSGQ
jgi:HK97 family phage prohead protease/HK97 family phage major capsid protein